MFNNEHILTNTTFYDDLKSKQMNDTNRSSAFSFVFIFLNTRRSFITSSINAPCFKLGIAEVWMGGN